MFPLLLSCGQSFNDEARTMYLTEEEAHHYLLSPIAAVFGAASIE